MSMILDEARVGGLMRSADGAAHHEQRDAGRPAVSPEDLYQAYAEVEHARAEVRGLQNDLKEAREAQRDAEGRLRDVYEQLRDQRAGR